MLRILRFAAVLIAASTVAATANAAVIFNFNFAIPAVIGTGATGSGQLFADQNSNGSYTVTGAQGTTYAYGGAPARTINDADLIGVIGSPTITGTGPSNYRIDSLSLTGQSTFTFAPNIFGDKYTGIGPAGSSTNSSLTLALASASVAAVPEPATWAMMIVGFGMVGGTIRRTRASLSLA